MNKDFYEGLLTAENKYDRLDGWWKADILVNSVDLSKYKPYFLEMLKDEDLDVALHAWQLLPKLLELKVVDRNDYDVKDFERALREGDINAWWIGYDLWKQGVIPLEVLKSNVQYFERALWADPMTRISAWSLLPHFLEAGLVNKPSKDGLTELLYQDLNIHVKVNVLYLILELREKGVIDHLDLEAVKEVARHPDFVRISEAYEKDWRKVLSLLGEDPKNATAH